MSNYNEAMNMNVTMNIGFTCGGFDLLTPDHIEMLRQCHAKCDRLIVGLRSSPHVSKAEPDTPIESTYERYTRLEALGYVDEIIVYDSGEDLRNIITMLENKHGRHFVRFLSKDQEFQPYPAKDLEVRTEFCEQRLEFSSAVLRQRIIEEYKERTYPKEAT